MNTASGQDLARELDRRFAESFPHAVVEEAEQRWPAARWEELQADGFATVGLPEELGGSGGSLSECCTVLRMAGRHAVPMPLVEAGLLAGWIAARTGEPLPAGLTTVAPTAHGGLREVRRDQHFLTLEGEIHCVPWARYADHVVVAAGAEPEIVALVPRSAMTVTESANLAGEPRDTISFNPDVPVPARRLTGASNRELPLLGALGRAALMSGAVERIADLTVGYTRVRHQFGRPVASFQAVAQHLVALAEAAAMARAAVDVAGMKATIGDGSCEMAAAKIVANQSAAVATKSAHQAHGAMGMTREYPLHQLTRRLWSWSAEYGNQRQWSVWIADNVRAHGPDRLYPFITDPARSVDLP